MKRKLIVLGLVVILVILMGCSSEKVGNPEAIKETTISFVTWNGAQEESLRNAIKGFNEKYPQIKVDLQITPWGEYWTKLEAAATSGTMPDVITNHVIYSQVYAQAEMLMPIEESELKKYDPDFSYANYAQGVTDIYKFDGKEYGVPKDIDCIVLAYNKALFDAKNLEYPNENWTWDDLMEAAERLTDTANDVYGFASYNNIQEGYGSMLYQNGGFILSPDKKQSGLDMPESIEAMQMYIDMIYKHGYSPTTAQLAETDRRTLFASGKLAMLYVGNWQLSGFVQNEDIAKDFDIAQLPKINGSRLTISNGLAHSIAATTKNEDAAKAFVAYMGSEEAMKLTAIGPAVPIYKNVDQVWAQQHQDSFNTSVVVDSIKNGVPYPATISRSKWEAAINNYVEQIFNGTLTVEEGFKKASLEMNEFLANE
jgi:multiple sugar transport system substrate-binding protein